MSDGIPLGTIAGLPVRANWSVLVLLWLFAWSLATTLPQTVPGYHTRDYWVAGVIGAVVLLMSLLAHELIHRRIDHRLKALAHTFAVERRFKPQVIPVQQVQLQNRGQRILVRRHSAMDQGANYFWRAAVVTCTDDGTGDQAFDIPFPWRESRLIEVIEVEHQLPVRRGIDAEIRHMLVPAAHHLNTA